MTEKASIENPLDLVKAEDPALELIKDSNENMSPVRKKKVDLDETKDEPIKLKVNNPINTFAYFLQLSYVPHSINRIQSGKEKCRGMERAGKRKRFLVPRYFLLQCWECKECP